MSTPHKCPACDGWGERKRKGKMVQCKPCGGTGILWGFGWQPRISEPAPVQPYAPDPLSGWPPSWAPSTTPFWWPNTSGSNGTIVPTDNGWTIAAP